MKKLRIIIVSMLLLVFTNALPTSANDDLLPLLKAMTEQFYVGELKGSIEEASTIEELNSLLDNYSKFYTTKEYEQETNAIEQTTVGIGILFQQTTEGLLILDVYENSSAQENGLRAGQTIVQVNGTDIRSLSSQAITNLIRGEEGTTVKLVLLDDKGNQFVKSLTRKAFTVPNVYAKMLYGEIGYIQLASFSTSAAFEVKESAIQLLNEGAQSFILDLQSNGGGYVSSAIQLISLFPNSVHAYIEKTNNYTKLITPVYLNFKFPNTTRLLVDRYSASASEMVAASVKDQDGAIIYGERTYGKGIIQTYFNVDIRGKLKLTTQEFFSPNQQKIQGVGVVPHKLTQTPLQQAHYDALVEKYAKYEFLTELKNVPKTKTFTLTFNQSVASALSPQSIELVNLGNESVPVKVAINGTKVIVTPEQPLLAGQQYVLFVHTEAFKSVTNKTLKNGYYATITVAK